ncbi:helix-turn-helix transcriptional regulator [Alkalihalophilus pseudofirmus]|uniref:helix-turn-helix domain-containing protein n=1 Tax=Alkalihalophilus pseudofirmus TaxID=79885 RepID=UPI00259B070E|nr:helix-turn-helix transcriptional regulator [Alkalihalophilus pseudofirmus]WEG18541.1 helix-turn-helix transcriptional regulator [Alkalihalophilus pseudofirmus]
MFKIKNFNDIKEQVKATDITTYYTMEMVGKLMARRDQLKIGIDELSVMSGVSASLINLIEDGEALPTLEAVIKLAHALKLNMKLENQ